METAQQPSGMKKLLRMSRLQRRIIHRTLQYRWFTTAECYTYTPSAWLALERCPRLGGMVVEVWPTTASRRHPTGTRSRADSAAVVGPSASVWFWEQCTRTTCSPVHRAVPPGAPAVAVVVLPSSLAVTDPSHPVWKTRPVSATVVDWQSARGVVLKTTTSSRLSTMFSSALNYPNDRVSEIRNLNCRENIREG